ncbi:C39 family peptidase [Sphingomonas sp. H160509]|uniref:C39 family peptidase n=1 Tax=Sphingomonas sp. H160509 TaxID=2955313 RepID=UPI002096E8AA|nr:C39 family peptidase [Sphingomonas sp. H160509]MDD1453254.1 C39 family peptidase [Sphingomonas sp. H160509]
MAKAGYLEAFTLATSVVMTGCSSVPLPEGGAPVNFSSNLNFTVPVTSMIGRKFETVVRQQYDFSCGSAALATLLRFHYDDPQNEQSVFLGMWRDGDRAQIQKLGFSLLDMKRYLAARGIAADGYKVSLAQVAAAKIPGIALINFNGYRHFVVVKGIDNDTLILGDPSLGLRREKIDRFQHQWNGVFFIVSGRQQVGQSHFNMAKDHVRAPQGRVFPGGDPLDLAALALTRPQPGDL